MTAHPTSDDEKDALSLAVAEGRIARLRGRIAKLKNSNRPTEVYESLLITLEESLELRKQHRENLGIDYRCYLMTGDRIRSVHVIRARSDADVTVKAAHVLNSEPEYEAIEIWDLARLVARIPRASPAANNSDSGLAIGPRGRQDSVG